MQPAAVFLPADPPRDGRMALWAPDGGPLPDTGAPAEHDFAAGPRPVRLLTAREALVWLPRAGKTPNAHPALKVWAGATVLALQLAARGRLHPGTAADGSDAWRAGPLDPADADRLRTLAAAMPPEGYDTQSPEEALRAWLDAVADTLPRTSAAVKPPPPRAPEPRTKHPEKSGVRVALRLDLPHDADTVHAVVQVTSLTDPGLVRDAADLWQDGPHQGFGPRAHLDVLLALRRAARVWDPVDRLLAAHVPDVLALDDTELRELLGPAVAKLSAAGIDVHWPRELVRDLTATVKIKDKPREVAAKDPTGLFGPDQLLDFQWQLAIGDRPLTDAEMETLAETRRPVVRLRDQWVLVDPRLAARARRRRLADLKPVDALHAALTGTVQVEGRTVAVDVTGRLAELRTRIADPARQELLDPPAALRATLRGYQQRGLTWLATMADLGLGGCLADDMGLGKTVTLIALHLHRQEALKKPTLVVCPTSLLGNWQREIERFAPGVPVRRHHAGNRDLDDVPADGFVLTTYGTMRRDHKQLATVGWGLVTADEAQHVKNPASATAKALRAIPAEARIALTGTPVENGLSELWAVLDWTTPGLLGTLKNFRDRYGKADTESLAQLSALIRPFLLRRRKSDPGVAPELPPKTETDDAVPLTKEQVGLYEAVVRENLAAIGDSAGMARRGLVLKLLTALKQICNHPAQFLKEDGPTKGRSGKLDLLDELIDTIRSEGESVLVFSQYVAMARLIESHLAARGVPCFFLHGGTSVAKREALVERFQNGEVPVFLLSLKAAGTGLNLTRAGHVVHYDRWWNPAVEDQATDRAHRIGQTKAVQVHRIVTEGTVEDRIAQLLRTKRELAEAVVGSGEAALSELTDDQLTELVALRRP